MTWLLFKIRLRSVLGGMLGNRTGGKNSGTGKKVLFAILMVYVVVVFAGLSVALCMQMCPAFSSIGLGWFYFALCGIMAFTLCFIGSVFATGNQLYNSKDNELLMSMPVSPGAILRSRMMVLMLGNYLYASVVLIPAGVVWCMYQPVTALGVLGYVVSCLALPFMAMSLSCLLGWIIAWVSSKMRNRNIITVVLNVAFLGVYLYFCSAWPKYMTKLMENGAQIAEAVRNAVFPAYHFGAAAADGNVLSLALFLLCAAVPFGIIYFILQHNYINIATANRGTAKKKYREKQMKSTGVKAALLKKEIRHYLANPMYIFNASIGAVFMLILAVYLIFAKDKMMSMLELMGMAKYAPAIACAALCMCASMVMVSAPSVSLEGKSLWLTQSLPVKAGDVLNAKAMCHIAVTVPFALLSSVICAVVLKSDVVQTIALVILPSVLTVFCAYFGVAINLKFPKFDWISEIHCVKQSASVMVVMFSMMALVIVMAVVYVMLLMRYVVPEVYLLAASVLLAIAVFLIYRWVNGRGSRIFEKL